MMHRKRESSWADWLVRANPGFSRGANANVVFVFTLGLVFNLRRRNYNIVLVVVTACVDAVMFLDVPFSPSGFWTCP